MTEFHDIISNRNDKKMPQITSLPKFNSSSLFGVVLQIFIVRFVPFLPRPKKAEQHTCKQVGQVSKR